MQGGDWGPQIMDWAERLCVPWNGLTRRIPPGPQNDTPGCDVLHDRYLFGNATAGGTEVAVYTVDWPIHRGGDPGFPVTEQELRDRMPNFRPEISLSQWVAEAFPKVRDVYVSTDNAENLGLMGKLEASVRVYDVNWEIPPAIDGTIRVVDPVSDCFPSITQVKLSSIAGYKAWLTQHHYNLRTRAYDCYKAAMNP